MTVVSTETVPVVSESDVVMVRRRVRETATRLGFSLVDQTKVVTAASELARNTLIYGHGGENGIRLTFSDKGPGIVDMALAMKDGYSTGKSLGLGLPGARRLVNEFEINSRPGEGTKVTVIRWK